MDDLISRQAAIRLVKTECNPYGKPTLDFESGKKVIEHLKQMPSAQPDLPIKEKCAFCPHCNNCDVNDDLSIQPCKDAISRQAAIDAIANCTNCGTPDELRKYVDKHSLENGWTGGVLDAMDAVEDIPAADVGPVVHGKWIPHREKSREYIGTVLVNVMYDYWLCDTCGYRVENGQPMYNFCPNCGAKMDGGKS